VKAIRVAQFGGPEVLKLTDVPDPTPGLGQVVVRVRAAGVNPADTYVREGKYAVKPDLPYTPGGEGAGEIKSLGRGVAGFTVGQRVYFSGTAAGHIAGAYAELALCGADQVYSLPDQVSFEAGGGIGVPYVTAYRAIVQRGAARPGQWVLVHGASGGVGIAAVQIALAMGCRVIGTGGSEAGRQLIKQQGVEHVLDHHDPGYLDQIMATTGGRGVDVVIEMLANVNLQKDMGLMAPLGRIVIVGNRGTVEIDPRGTMGKQLDIRGMAVFSATAAQLAEAHAAIGAGLRNQSLRPIVGQTFKLGEAAAVHEAVLRGPAVGKIVLVV
jgi:NADPH2:quinone reductase